MASPRLEGSPEPPALDVHRLESDGSDSESVVMVKLTDEIFTALMSAQRKGVPIRIRVDDQGGIWELGDTSQGGGSVFRYQEQALPGPPTDAVIHDRRTGTHRAVASFRSKYQIQATDKSFAETKERAQKLIEDEKSRGVKDVTKHRQKGLAKTASRVGSASSSRHSSPLLSKPIDSQSRISPNKLANSTGTNGHAPSTNNGSFAGRAPTQHLNSELRKKKLRQRIIQLVVTGKLHNSDEVLKILRKDGLGEEQDSPRRVDEIVREVADSTGCGDSARLALKPSLNGEVDTRWPWFTQEEKAYVRRITQNLSQTKSSSFAPMRKSGMERMQAPSHAPQQTVSPEAIPTPPSSRPSSVVGHPTRKTPPKLPAQSRDSPVQIIDHRGPLDDTASTGSKRKAHVPSSLHTDKRPRQESSSPPEDPSSHPTSHNQKILAVRAGGSTASSRLSSPCSLSSPSQPSCDWEKNFVEIKSVHDAEKYFSLFQQDYPEYLECYKMLNDVAKEFRHLEAQLKNAGDNRKDCARIEQNIQNRFAHFDKDPEFLKTRQRHADLRAKLSVLKQRISDWERNQDSTLSMDMCAL